MTLKKQTHRHSSFTVILFIGLAATFSFGFCGNTPSLPLSENTLQTDTNDIYQRVDQMPKFSRGNPLAWIAKNVKYPAEAAKQKIQGKVFTQFCIEKDGSISNLKVLRGVHPLLDAEAVRVIGSMPKWTPGILKGKNVRVNYTIPINFQLGGSLTPKHNKYIPKTPRNNSHSSKQPK